MDNSSSNIIDVFTKLIRSLECPVCYEYVSSPIWQCQSGHVLCNICKSSIHSCPTCREPYSPVRVRSLEYISELMLFPCKNDGCNEFLPLVKMTNHEMRCTRASATNFNDESSRVAFLQTTLLYHIEQHIAPFFINKSNTDRETQTVPDILPKVQKKDACTWTELKSNDGNPYPYSGDGEHLLASPAMFKDEPETSQNYTFKGNDTFLNKNCKSSESTATRRVVQNASKQLMVKKKQNETDKKVILKEIASTSGTSAFNADVIVRPSVAQAASSAQSEKGELVAQKVEFKKKEQHILDDVELKKGSKVQIIYSDSSSDEFSLDVKPVVENIPCSVEFSCSKKSSSVQQPCLQNPTSSRKTNYRSNLSSSSLKGNSHGPRAERYGVRQDTFDSDDSDESAQQFSNSTGQIYNRGIDSDKNSSSDIGRSLVENRQLLRITSQYKRPQYSYFPKGNAFNVDIEEVSDNEIEGESGNDNYNDYCQHDDQSDIIGLYDDTNPHDGDSELDENNYDQYHGQADILNSQDDEINSYESDVDVNNDDDGSYGQHNVQEDILHLEDDDINSYEGDSDHGEDAADGNSCDCDELGIEIFQGDLYEENFDGNIVDIYDEVDFLDLQDNYDLLHELEENAVDEEIDLADISFENDDYFDDFGGYYDC